MNPKSSPPIREVAVILALTIVGAVVRLSGMGRLGLSHFDEGIYAMAGFWAASPDGLAAIPTRLIPFAPPGLSILIGVAYLIFGFSDAAAIAVSQAAGIVTIPIVGWLGRRTFGTGSGAATSALAAVAGSHVIFSRMALTDVPFLLAWMIGIGLGGRFLERPAFGRALMFGLSVGMAQNFKYNGWLLVLVVGMGGLFGLVRRRDARFRETMATVGFGLLAVVVAFIVDLPWVRFVEEHVGYRQLLSHHRGYFDGIRAWPRNWSSQMDQSITLSGGPMWGASAGFLAVLGIAMLWPWWRITSRSPVRSVLILGVVGIGLAAALAAFPTLPWWIGLGMTPWLLVDDQPAIRIVGAWWLILTILTPLYHPYARLWLPLQAAGWLLVGGQLTTFWAELRCLAQNGLRKRLDRRSLTTALALLVFLVGFGRSSLAWPRSEVLRPTDDLARLSTTILPEAAAKGGLRLLASPALEFYLRLQGIPLELLRDEKELLKTVRSPKWGLVDEVILRQGADPSLSPARVVNTLGLVREVTYPLGVATALDVDPGLVGHASQRSEAHLWLIRRPDRR